MEIFQCQVSQIPTPLIVPGASTQDPATLARLSFSLSSPVAVLGLEHWMAHG